MLSSAPVPAPDASKMPSKVFRQVELAEIIHIPVGNFFCREELTQVFLTLPVLSTYP